MSKEENYYEKTVETDSTINYEKDIHIDPDALDIEWLEQPKLMLKYTKNLAIAEYNKDQAKEKLDLMKAELDLQIRKDPAGFELEKVTESSVLATILTLDEYKEANEEYLEAKYEYNTAKGVVEGFRDRKHALENEVQLYITNYCAGPKVPRNLNDEWAKRSQQKRTNQRIGEGMRRTIRRK